MKLTLTIARVLIRLVDGEVIPASAGKNELINDLVRENIVFRKGKHRKTLQLLNERNLHLYLENQLQIKSLSNYISALEDENSSRSDFVKITGDSKDSKERAFQGFLVNCYQPISAELNGSPFTVNPSLGSFIFIADYTAFNIPGHITVIGIENSKNFSDIRKQKHLFENITPLFISRYPQNQSNDFIKWMKSIPNNYLHFGDFDLAGIGIYLNEYKRHLKEKATFYIPDNIEEPLKKHGNRTRFDIQKVNFNIERIEEPALLQLIQLIQFEKKGLDQEYYIIP
jgi:hypothetical protein